jgi:hypothetical protein
MVKEVKIGTKTKMARIIIVGERYRYPSTAALTVFQVRSFFKDEEVSVTTSTGIDWLIRLLVQMIQFWVNSVFVLG